MNIKDKIDEELKIPEDEYHYFKKQWYVPEKRDEMMKNIFNCAS